MFVQIESSPCRTCLDFAPFWDLFGRFEVDSECASARGFRVAWQLFGAGLTLFDDLGGSGVGRFTVRLSLVQERVGWFRIVSGLAA